MRAKVKSLVWVAVVPGLLLIIESSPNGGEYVYSQSATTSHPALVTTHLCSGESAGGVRLVPGVGALESEAIEATDCPGEPDPAHFELAAQKLNLYAWHIEGVPDTITVYVGDEHGNPVSDSTKVHFSTDCGTISPDSCYTQSGVCSTELTSSAPWPEPPHVDTAGFFFVHAQTASCKDSVRILWSSSTTVTIIPSTFDIPDGGCEDFTYEVCDSNGNPLTEGTHITVAATTGRLLGDIDVTLPDTRRRGQLYTQFRLRLADDDPGNPGNPDGCQVTVSVTSDNGDRTESASGTID